MSGLPTSKRICVIIPAFNEASVVADVFNGVKKEFTKNKLDFEIVVVDDCSTDETAKIVRKTSATLIRHIINTGSGGATATGLAYAKKNGFEIAATMDADGQHDPKDLVKGLKDFQKNGGDLLIGSRLLNSEGMSRTKVLGNKGLSLITNLLYGVRVSDSQSGLRIYSSTAIQRLYWKSNNYEFCSEMIWRAKRLKLTIREFPIKAIYTKYSISKGQNNWNAFNIVKSLVQRRIMELFGE